MLRQLLSANRALSYSPGEEGVGNLVRDFLLLGRSPSSPASGLRPIHSHDPSWRVVEVISFSLHWRPYRDGIQNPTTRCRFSQN
jgi:hypothetical protein